MPPNKRSKPSVPKEGSQKWLDALSYDEQYRILEGKINEMTQFAQASGEFMRMNAPRYEAMLSATPAAPMDAIGLSMATKATSTDTASAKLSGLESSTGSSFKTEATNPDLINFGGRFVGFTMNDTDLRSHYLPPKPNPPSFASLHNRMQQRIGKPYFSFELGDELRSGSLEGKFNYNYIREPMNDDPLYNVRIGGMVKSNIHFSDNEIDKSLPSSFIDGPGFDGTIAWDADGHGCAIPSSATGKLKMQRVFKHGSVSKTDAKDVGNGKGKEIEKAKTTTQANTTIEIWAGYFKVSITDDSMLKQKGHGSGETLEMKFWALRFPSVLSLTPRPEIVANKAPEPVKENVPKAVEVPKAMPSMTAVPTKAKSAKRKREDEKDQLEKQVRDDMRREKKMYQDFYGKNSDSEAEEEMWGAFDGYF